MSAPLLLGHRGARATRTVPENTLASFDLALAHGCDGFEFDVRRTADGRSVICHDASIDGCSVTEATAEELNHLPQLESILDRYAHKAFLDVELKVTGLESAVLHALQSHPPSRGYVVSSFLPEVLQALSKLDSTIPLGLICETPPQLAAWKTLPIEYVIPHHTLVNQELGAALHQEGKKIFVWTVNKRDEMYHFRDIGVDAIISDDTKLMVAILKTES